MRLHGGVCSAIIGSSLYDVMMSSIRPVQACENNWCNTRLSDTTRKDHMRTNFVIIAFRAFHETQKKFVSEILALEEKLSGVENELHQASEEMRKLMI